MSQRDAGCAASAEVFATIAREVAWVLELPPVEGSCSRTVASHQ